MEEKGIRLEKNYIAIAFDAISKAGKIALSFEKEKIHFWNKSVGQPVTHADIEINLFLKKFFEKHTPEFGWLSEESEDDKSGSEDQFYIYKVKDGETASRASKTGLTEEEANQFIAENSDNEYEVIPA